MNTNSFEINYHIYNHDKEWLSKISLEEFEKEYGEFYGQFEIKVHNNSFRFVNSDYEKDIHFTSLAEEKEFYETLPTEIINLWFNKLLSAAVSLHSNDYTAIQDIESSLWLNFTRKRDKLKIGLLTEDSKYIWQAEEIGYDFFLKELSEKTKKFILEIQNINPLLLESKVMIQLLKNYSLFFNFFEINQN